MYATLLPQNILQLHFSCTLYSQWRSQHKNLEGAKKFFGGKMFDFRQITPISWDTASQSTK